MLPLFFKLFTRNLVSNKLYLILGMLGLVVGLSGSYVLFLWISNEISYDRFHKDSDRIYRIVREDYVEGDWVKNVFTPLPLAYELVERYPGIIASTSVWLEGQHTFSYKESKLIASQYYCSETFFEVFDFPVIVKSEADFFPHQNSAVVSKEFALRMFGNTQYLGKELVMHFYGKTSFFISAVVDVPENSHFNFDVLLLYSSNDGFSNAHRDWLLPAANYIKLGAKGALDKSQIEEIKSLLQTQSNSTTRISFQPLHDIYLFTDFDDRFSQKKSNYITVRLISVIAYVLLALSVFNYIMLFTSRSESRGKEIAIKKLMGVSRGKLIGQYTLEILLITLMALALSLILVSFILPYVNNLSGTTLHLVSGWDLGLYLFITGFSVSVLSASYITLYLSGFTSLNLLRGKTNISPRFRINTLVATLQLAFAIGFVIFSLSLLAQFRYISNKEKGLETNNILVLPTNALGYEFVTLKSRLLEHSGILSVAAGGRPPIDYQFSPVQQIKWEGMELPANLDVTVMAVDPDYLQTFQIELVEGDFLPKDMSVDRYFSGHYQERTPVIINERFANLMGFEDPIGKSLYMDRFKANGIITGIVKDFHFRPLTHKIEPVVMYYDPEGFGNMYIRVEEDNFAQTLDYINGVAEEVKKGDDIIHAYLLEDAINIQYREHSVMNHFVFFATLATICLAIMGVLGMLSYEMVRDKKNITIRRIFGADIMQLRFLYARRTSLLFLLGYLPTLAITWLVVDRWLSAFAYVYNPFMLISLLVFLIGQAMMVILVVLSIQKTCSTNPADLIKKI